MSTNDDGYLRAWHRSAPVSLNPLTPMPKIVGGPLTVAGATAWAKINDVPSAYYAQLTGTSGAITATCHFEFGDDIPGPGGNGSLGIAPAGVGTTISLSGTGTGGTGSTSPQASGYVGSGQFGADASVSPLVPWKYCRLVVTAISGTGAQVAGFQNLGGV